MSSGAARRLRRASIEAARMVVEGLDCSAFVADEVVAATPQDLMLAYIDWIRPRAAADITSRRTLEPVSQKQSQAQRLAHTHPILGLPGWTERPWLRVSELVDLRDFWDSPAWEVFHGGSDARYVASIQLGQNGDTATFVALQRSRQDFSVEEMELLSSVREPLASALRFRASMTSVVAALRQEDGEASITALTDREIEVLRLVAAGWTSRRVGRALGITERTVRQHLTNVYGKLQVTNRTSAAMVWRRMTTLPSPQVPPRRGPAGPAHAPGQST